LIVNFETAYICNLEGIPILKKTIDFDAISNFNKNEGILSGTMMDALIQRATGKVVELYSDDRCLDWGMIILGTTECLLRIMDNIIFLPKNLFPVFQTSDILNNNNDVHNESSNGLVHSLIDKVEVYSLLQRGEYKSYNYKGDAQLLNNPISLWSQTDKSRMSTSTFGSNSFIRMYGKNQVVDINGKEISFHECTNIVAGFSTIITLSNGHFNSLTSQSCNNCFIITTIVTVVVTIVVVVVIIIVVVDIIIITNISIILWRIIIFNISIILCFICCCRN
jgi:hypothetical protein